MTMPGPNRIGSQGNGRPAAVSVANQREMTSRARPRVSPPVGHAMPRGRATSHVRVRPVPLPGSTIGDLHATSDEVHATAGWALVAPERGANAQDYLSAI